VHYGLHHPQRFHVSICPRSWPSPWPIAGVDNLACFEYLPFASFRFLQSLNRNSVLFGSQVFYSVPHKFAVAIMC